ncbi:MAG: hypothetical protein MUF50_02130 [Planctomycetes bacterium]|jgi:heme A synthase|nr:hypothetical protein [Planctomycetota bacterium]
MFIITLLSLAFIFILLFFFGLLFLISHKFPEIKEKVFNTKFILLSLLEIILFYSSIVLSRIASSQKISTSCYKMHMWLRYNGTNEYTFCGKIFNNFSRTEIMMIALFLFAIALFIFFKIKRTKSESYNILKKDFKWGSFDKNNYIFTIILVIFILIILLLLKLKVLNF